MFESLYNYIKDLFDISLPKITRYYYFFFVPYIVQMFCILPDENLGFESDL